MATPKKQVGGRKETPLATVGSNRVQEQEETLSAYEEELLYFRKLLQGFFEKFAKWQDVAETEGIETGVGERKLEVFTTPTGLHIAKPGEIQPLDNKVLELRSVRKQIGYFQADALYFTITPGSAGKQLLVDLDRNPIKEAKIHIIRGNARQTLDIYATLPPYAMATTPPYTSGEEIIRGTRYETSKHGLINSNIPVGDIYDMFENYETHMINTIHALIPGTPTATPQPERRANQERAIPMKLPAPGRRRPRA